MTIATRSATALCGRVEREQVPPFSAASARDGLTYRFTRLKPLT
jgi:hypothetical protein